MTNPTSSKAQLLLTTEEAAEILRIGRTTVYALISEGVLNPVHIGRSCRISRAELERYVAALENPRPQTNAAPRHEITPVTGMKRRRAKANQRGLFEVESEATDAVGL